MGRVYGGAGDPRKIVVSAQAEPRPIKRAALYLVGLGAFFYASYGFSNWAAAQRANVPSIVFDWEYSIPFVAWTIIPYWTTNLFYAGSLLLCRTRKTLDTHAKRLLGAQIIAVACFLIAPLKFAWPRPEVEGAIGDFYKALTSFDQPFNEAPSLHVALTLILLAFYIRILPRWAGLAFGLWSALVIVSVLTTYQHHFIDVPTGAALGFFCIWLFPFEGCARMRLTRGVKNLRLAACYAFGALVCAFLAFDRGGAMLGLIWPALALAGVFLAYAAFGPAIFGKSSDGRMNWPQRIIFAPYRFGAWINARLWTHKDKEAQEIAPGVFLGRFPSLRDALSYACVVDLTAEFHRPGGRTLWRAVPCLDLVAPAASALAAAAAAIELAPRPTLVCCALGYGRSVCALAVWLVHSGRASDAEESLALLRRKRPRLSVSQPQKSAILKALHATVV